MTIIVNNMVIDMKIIVNNMVIDMTIIVNNMVIDMTIIVNNMVIGLTIIAQIGVDIHKVLLFLHKAHLISIHSDVFMEN